MSEGEAIDNNMMYVRPAEMSPLAWATRLLALAFAVLTAAVAVFATIDGELQQRESANEVRAAADYTGVAYLAGRQRQLVLASHGGSSDELRESARLTRDIRSLLSSLRARSEGKEADGAAALASMYASALQDVKVALGGASPRVRARNVRVAAGALEEVEATATRPLRHGANTTVRLATALTAALALILAFALARLRLYRRREGDRTDVEVARLRAAALTDNLTGLGNHRAFHHDLLSEVRRRARTGSSFTLMAIDLDGLKLINDAHGHQAGDTYIRQVSDCLRQAIAEDGTVYRTGGDEFMALLPGRRNWHGFALAQKVAELTRAAIGRRAVSIGVTESMATETQQQLIHQADLALYEAKRSKLTAVIYHPGLMPAARTSEDAPSHHQKALAVALARAVDAKSIGTRNHSETVAELCVAIGISLGLEGETLERLRLAGLLHDVGKIGVADAILQKPAALVEAELEQVRQHVSVGHGILVSAELPVEAEWILHHHERRDGGGYPAGLRGDEIPLESRIIAVAEAFEAMTEKRPYRDRLTRLMALAELVRGAGTQFDEACVDALVHVVDLTAETESAAIAAA